MLLNHDFTARAALHGARMPWVKSPTPGVDRRMLFRIGQEKARATSIVRYAPDSDFPRHGHPGGEEILVLDGVFEDDSGDYPAGSYMRNPPGTRHTPGSVAGCVIFVKLWQFRKDDDAYVVQPPDEAPHRRLAGRRRPRASCSTMAMKRCGSRIGRRTPRSRSPIPRGLELLVLDGEFSDGTETFARLSWLRLPPGAHLKARTGTEGARVWRRRARCCRTMSANSRLRRSRNSISLSPLSPPR